MLNTLNLLVLNRIKSFYDIKMIIKVTFRSIMFHFNVIMAYCSVWIYFQNALKRSFVLPCDINILLIAIKYHDCLQSHLAINLVTEVMSSDNKLRNSMLITA